MKKNRLLRGFAVVLSCLGIAMPQVSMAIGPVTQGTTAAPIATAQITDVALGQGGLLKGQVISSSGAAQAGARVMFVQNGKQVAATVTDGEGYFAVKGLSGGVYQVATGESVMVYRVWAANTAPPIAHNDILLVAGENVVRGQGGILYGLSNPWVIGAGVAAAIAIPVALANDKKPAS